MFHYSTLEDAVLKGHNYVFSVECKNNDNVSRYFITFKNIDEYLNVIERYNNCHEIVHEKRKFNNCQIGRIAFDIDTTSSLPDDYKKRFQDAILRLLKQHYDVSDKEINFIWLNCHNEKKISKHLIIQGIMFYEWSEQLKIFYKQLQNFIHQSLYKTIDVQIARKNGSLRLPLNSKIDGNPLFFDDHDITLTDVKDDRFKKIFCSGMIFYNDVKNRERMIEHKYVIEHPINNIEVDNNDNVQRTLESAYNKFFCDDDYGFSLSTYNNGFLRLERYKPYKCLISNIVHDNDHGYLYAHKGKVFFGCFRKCVDDKGYSKRLISNNDKTKFPHNKQYSLSIFQGLI